jgi:hypothetical protein
MQHEFNSSAAGSTETTTDTEDGRISVNKAITTPPSDRKHPNSVYPADVRAMLGTTNAKAKKVQWDSTYSTNVHETIYRVSNHRSTPTVGALMDRGSNGGVAGEDVRRITEYPTRTVTIEGIDRHQMNNIPLHTVGGVTKSSVGPAIIVMSSCAYTGRGTTIICPAQLEYYGTVVDDRSRVTGGKQCVTTTNGVVIPLNIVNGLPRMSLRPFTDAEWDTLPIIFLSDDSKEWDPTVLDNTLTDDEYWLASHPAPQNPYSEFDNQGNYRHRSVYSSEWT